MSDSGDWQRRVSNVIRSELKLRGMTYRDLAERLNALGLNEKEYTVKNKVGRGTFSAVFFAQCLEVLGSSRLNLD